MEKGPSTYLVSFFFIFLLFAKDLFMVFPGLAPASSIALIHHDFAEDESEKNRTGEEVTKTGTSEFIDGHYPITLELPFFQLDKGKNFPGNTSFDQTFYGSVLTPPPDQV